MNTILRLRLQVPFVLALLGICAGRAKAQGDLNVLFAPAAAEGPTRVFTAAKIITMEPANPTATAVAIADQRILAVGSLEEVRKALADRPFVLDQRFEGKVMMPGLIEQHLHPILGALCLSVEVIAIEDWVLPGRTIHAATNQEEYRARLRQAHAAITDPKEFLFTWGFHRLWHGPLSRKELDAVSTTRPIVVWHRSCHEFTLNTRALEALEITRASVEGQGQASSQVDWEKGHFYEKGLELITGRLLPRMATPERMRSGLEMLIKYLHQSGVTAINEPGAIITPELLGLYQSILGAANTPFSTTLIPDGRSLFDRHGEDDAIAATEKVVALAPSGKVAFLPNQIKLFADGAVFSQLMQMKGGYTDGHKGEWIATPQDIRAATKLYWDAGYQIHIHVNGDLGLEVVLDALERCMRETPRYDHRTVLVHLACSTEQQVARIARLGAVVSANPYYVTALADRYGKEGLDVERSDQMVRLGSLSRRGVPISLHSDLPMSPVPPLFLAWCAVNRVTSSGRIAAKDQRLGVEQALRAITIDAAQSWRMETEMGSIAPGKVANFVVLEEDPLAIDPMKLKDIAIWGTVFEGTVFPVR
ncbi:MAG TPA: amidohydrolase [Isosphaeraceae bacterium]|nr:amidohydrolase [Isosphaeraceae bacterium]